MLWDETTAASEQLGARRTLITVLEKSLRLLHPFMPFLTEEIWQTVSPLTGESGESIMLAPWPARQPDRMDAESEAEIEWLKQIIVGIRTIRSESNIPPATELPVFVVNATELDRERFGHPCPSSVKARHADQVPKLTCASPSDRAQGQLRGLLHAG